MQLIQVTFKAMKNWTTFKILKLQFLKPVKICEYSIVFKIRKILSLDSCG